MLTTDSGSQNFLIAEYTPKTRSEESLTSHRLFSRLRSKLSEPALQSRKELEALTKMIKTHEDVRNDMTQEIRATLPKEIVPGSVGEKIYGCLLGSEANGKLSACTPECVTGPPLSGTGGCQMPVYLKTNEKFTKLNDISGEEAKLYTSDSFSELSSQEEDTLRSQGVAHVTVYQRESGTHRYHTVKKISLASQSESRTEDCSSSSSKKSVSWSEDTETREREKEHKTRSPTRSDKDTSCDSGKTSQSSSCAPACETSGSNWGLLAALAVIVVIILILVAVFWWFGASSSVVATSGKPTTVTTSHTVVSQPLSWV